MNPDDVEEALLEFLNEMPIDTFLALEVSTREQRRHLAVIESLAKNYRGNGAPYGETMGDLRRWISERASQVEPTARGQYTMKKDTPDVDGITDVDRETDSADAEAADRAADEGMIDREEEQLVRAEDAQAHDSDDTEDKHE